MPSMMSQFMGGGGQPNSPQGPGGGGYLNQESGFGSRPGGTFQVYDPQLAQNADMAQRGFYNQGKLAQQQYGFQTGLAAQQGDIARGLQSGQLASANLASERNLQGTLAQAHASELGPKLAMQRFNTVFPFLSKALGNVNGMSGGGTSTGGEPAISAAPVYSQQQIQQQVNTQRANNDTQTAGETRSMQQRVGGRGLGSNSPLAQALGTMLQGQNLATNTANETGTRMNAAGMNAQQVLSGQTEQEKQYASRQAEGLQRQGIQAGSLNALLAALAGMS